MNQNVSDDVIIKVEDLTIAYEDKPVLWDVELDIKKGILMAIVGPNGAGKSTLIKAMLDLIKRMCLKEVVLTGIFLLLYLMLWKWDVTGKLDG